MALIAQVGTGSGGALQIYDDGVTIQAVINSTNPSTFVNGLAWSVYLGAGSASGTVNISGPGAYVVWSGGASSTVAMQFNMAASGTSGLGGPTTLNATINRSTVPSQVQGLSISNIGPTSAQINFSAPASNGGAAIDYYLIRISKNNPPTTAYTDKVGNTGTVLTGLTPATQYYVTVYAHNAVGYSLLCTPVGFKSLGLARIRVAGVWVNATPYVRVAGVWTQAVPYIKVAGVWVPAS